LRSAARDFAWVRFSARRRGILRTSTGGADLQSFARAGSGLDALAGIVTAWFSRDAGGFVYAGAEFFARRRGIRGAKPGA